MTVGGVGRGWWDAAFENQGHTGWADRQVYRYDQPLRVSAIGRLVRDLCPHGLRGAVAVDVGCGTGDFTALLSGAGASVLAFDFSAGVLAAARVGADPGRTQLCCASASSIPVATGAASIVTCVTVLQHLVDEADWNAALAELRRIVRPDGSIVLLELAPPVAAAVLCGDGHVIERPPASWRAGLDSAGLEIVREGVYPQWGITLLRLLARAIDNARGGRAETIENTVSSGGRRLTIRRRVLRSGLWLIRTLVLACAWPLDAMGAQVPLSHRYYRLWVLRSARGRNVDAVV